MFLLRYTTLHLKAEKMQLDKSTINSVYQINNELSLPING
jgi:hypothetical protein